MLSTAEFRFAQIAFESHCGVVDAVTDRVTHCTRITQRQHAMSDADGDFQIAAARIDIAEGDQIRTVKGEVGVLDCRYAGGCRDLRCSVANQNINVKRVAIEFRRTAAVAQVIDVNVQRDRSGETKIG